MSSRNTYLNEEERKQATILNQALVEGEKAFLAGETAVEKLVAIIADKIKEMPLAEIDYVNIYDFPSLTEIKKVEHRAPRRLP